MLIAFDSCRAKTVDTQRPLAAFGLQSEVNLSHQ
jgi:hypothetical protein